MRTFRCAAFLAILFLLLATSRGAFAAVDEGLLFHLPMTTDLLDHSPARLPVKITNQVEIRDGAGWFSGKESWLELPHVDFYGRPFAVALWMSVSGANPMYGLVEQKDANKGNRWLHIMLRGGRQPYLGFYINDAISPLNIGAREWTHVVFQYTGTHQQVWVNGQLICSKKAKAYGGKAGPTLIGKSPRWNNVPSLDFDGYMRDVRGYGRALSVWEIAELSGSSASVTVASQGTTLGAPAPVKRIGRKETDAVEQGIPFLAIDGRKLVVTGEARQVYVLQVTSDLLRPWQDLTVFTNKFGRVELTDPERGAGQRFYRLVLTNNVGVLSK